LERKSTEYAFIGILFLVDSIVPHNIRKCCNNNKQSIEDRIVSLSQPPIRPIVRGKAGKSVEFGAKLSASCFEEYVFLDRMSWDNFNESGDLKANTVQLRRK
jgi:hypothetical protein